MTSKNTIRDLIEELRNLKAEQEKMMALAVYVGMTKEEEKQSEDRQKCIYQLYTTLFAMGEKGPF